MSLKDKLIALVCVFIWGINFMFLKMGVAEFSPQLMNALRFLLAGMFLLPFCKFPHKDELKRVVMLAMVLALLDFFPLLIGMKYVDASVTAVVFQSNVTFAILLAWLFFKEAFGIYQLIGIVLSFVGVFILAGEPTITMSWALLLIVLASFGNALANIIVKGITKTSKISVNGWSSLLIGMILMIASLLMENNHMNQIETATWRGWLGIVIPTIFASCVAFSLWYTLLSRNDVSKIAPYHLLTPVIGFTAGMVFLGETVTIHKGIGCLLIIGGVAIIELRQYMSGKKKAAIIKEGEECL